LSVFVSLSPCMNVLSCYGRWRCDDVTVVINTDGLLNFSDTCSQFPHAGFSDDGPSGQTLEIEREEMSNDRCLHITKRVKERMKWKLSWCCGWQGLVIVTTFWLPFRQLIIVYDAFPCEFPLGPAMTNSLNIEIYRKTTYSDMLQSPICLLVLSSVKVSLLLVVFQFQPVVQSQHLDTILTLFQTTINFMLCCA
jgi:hypothetical protein